MEGHTILFEARSLQAVDLIIAPSQLVRQKDYPNRRAIENGRSRIAEEQLVSGAAVNPQDDEGVAAGLGFGQDRVRGSDVGLNRRLDLRVVPLRKLDDIVQYGLLESIQALAGSPIAGEPRRSRV